MTGRLNNSVHTNGAGMSFSVFLSISSIIGEFLHVIRMTKKYNFYLNNFV